MSCIKGGAFYHQSIFLLHPSYLSEAFNEQVGKTIQRFVTEVKVAEGKRMLQLTSLPMKEVAVRFGYEDEFILVAEAIGAVSEAKRFLKDSRQGGRIPGMDVSFITIEEADHIRVLHPFISEAIRTFLAIHSLYDSLTC
ncbi:helix-turn-helix domain-containing protein [Shouchella patagoniensis]|uniref:helix-turn-helix domain-containing protein n=1 Tax=Shouchella patagoniensis TaxID=228576 RepID=UPI0009955B60|nr:helix-turn-helix domain-containing protein [Shouchella patagoniensis]